MLFEVLLILLIALLTIIYIWQSKSFSYWKLHHVKYIKPTPFLGNMNKVFCVKEAFYHQFWTLYKEPKFENEPVVGIYLLHKPALLLRDLDLINRVLIKDFNSFCNRNLMADPVHDALGTNNLFFVRYSKWRHLRPKLAPVFMCGKVKQMYPLMEEIGRELESHLATIPDATVLEFKDLCSRFTTDLIGTTAFGIRANSIRNPNSDFFVRSRAIFDITLGRTFDFACVYMLPAVTSILRVKVFSEKSSEFLRKSIGHVIKEREKSGLVRNDLIDTLIKMKNEALAHPETNNPAKNPDFLVAQAAIFQVSGYDTSSSTMAFALYELALQPQLQNRLRTEIRDAFREGHGSISYEKMHEMVYLSQVVNETLRLYPIVGYLERQCTPYEGTKGYSLQPFYDFEIPAGMPVYISQLGLHRDEKYWPDPEKFDPGRFSPQNRQNINWNAYLPFGIGPHNCIGMRLGLVQTKLGLIHLLRNHRVVTCRETTKTVEFDPLSVLLCMKENINLKLKRVN